MPADAAIDPFGLPPEEAIKWFRAKGMKLSWDWRDTWQQEHSQAFTVAKAMRDDILAALRQGVDDALANGTTLAQFRKELKPFLQREGWWGKKEEVDPQTGEVREVQLGSPRRLKTIYDTNLRQSHSAGRWQTAQRLKATRPYLRYVHRFGKTPRPGARAQHQKWHDVVRPVDDPIWDSIMPMNGWGCHCKVQQLSERDVARYGLKVSEEFSLEKTTWTNKRTGQTMLVTQGVDPGFDYNPGKTRFVSGGPMDPGSVKAPAAAVSRQSVGPELLDKFKPVRSVWTGDEYKRAMASQQKSLGEMPDSLEEAAAKLLVATTGAKVPVALAMKHPRLVAALGDKLQVHDYDDPKVVQSVADLAKLRPEFVHQVAHYRDHYVKEYAGVFIGARKLTSMNGLMVLAGVRPRGWAPGKTWDVVGGAGGMTHAVVAVHGEGGSASTILHEFGHSTGARTFIKTAKEQSIIDHSDALRAHHKRMFQGLSEYQQQDGPGGLAGRQEMFAESVAKYYTQTEESFVATYDREYRKWLKQILEK